MMILKKFIVGFSIFLLLVSCGGDKAKVSGGKLVQIAVWEDKRQVDTLLYDYLMDTDPEVRARAAYALGMIAPEGASAYLVELLEDPSKKVRLEAVFALGLLADEIYSEYMIPAINDPDHEIKKQAIISLGKMGGDTAIATLLKLTNDTIPEWRAYAAEGLWRAEAKSEEVVNRLLAMTADSSLLVEYNALLALERLEIPEAAEKFRFRLRDTIPENRMEGVRGMYAISDTAGLMQMSEALARERDWRIEASLVATIKKVGNKKIMRSLMNLLSPSEHPLVTGLALSTIGKFKIDLLFPKVLPFLQSDYDYLKGEAILCLAQLDGNKMLVHLSEQLPGFNWYLRMKTAEALQYFKSPNSIATLERFFSDENPSVRAQALTSLHIHEYSKLDSLLQIALEDDDMTVSLTAVDIVAEKEKKEFYDQFKDIYERGMDENNEDMRFGLLYTITYMIDSVLPAPEIEEVMKLALDDDKRIVREKAIEAYEKAGIDYSDMLGHFETNLNAETYSDYFNKYELNPVAVINTSKGPITVELLYDEAPKTVENFITLAENGFYEGIRFHRVVPNFVIQAGDPLGNGMGGPGYTIRCEYNRHEYKRGTMGMAHAGKDTGGSQFFICHSAQPHLNARYTAFGQVIDGLHRVDNILVGDTIESVEITYQDK